MMISEHEGVAAHLDMLLELVCEQLQLTPTQHQTAARSYNAVGEFLDEPGTLLATASPSIHPQGSKALGTTNKPRAGEEFDVDLLCLLRNWDPNRFSPAEVFDAVLARLKESGVYAPKLFPMQRCIRIDYAGHFHLDIVPGCPAPLALAQHGAHAIVIPDRRLKRWITTNPRGYALWFAERAHPAGRRIAASVEPLTPDGGLSEKTVLHRIVQLFKRRRDVQFGADEFAPKSILLTTLAARCYHGETSLLSVTERIIADLDGWVSAAIDAPPEVNNPTNPSENLARHWGQDRRHFTRFAEYLAAFRDGIARLQSARGIDNITDVLRELFDPTGTGIVREAVSAYATRFQGAREERRIGYLPRRASVIAVAPTPHAKRIPRHQFYGADN